MLAVSLLAERRAYLEAHAQELDAMGKRLVVANGYARAREVTTGAGMVEVSAPRVDDRREGEHFSSAILPAYMRKSPKVTEVLPILYLRGLSTGDFAPALGEFFGAEAGLSASSINRLTVAFQAEHEEWSTRDLSGVDYVYWWVDGIHFNIRLEEDRLCCLVIVGVRPDGTKELVALADGYRESTESWAEVLRSLKDRGLSAPVLAVGDGALGFWAALRDIFPETREQRCWVHVTANCLDALAQAPARRRQGGHRQDLLGASRPPPSKRSRHIRRVQRLPQGRQEDHRPARRPAGLLRLPPRALDPPADHQPDRVHLLDGQTPDQGDPWRGFAPSSPGDGLQTARRRPGSLAPHQRPRARSARPRRRHVHRRQATRKECDDDRQRQQHRVRRRLNEKPHPQLLTMTLIA